MATATLTHDYSASGKSRFIWTIAAAADTIPEATIDYDGSFRLEVIATAWGGSLISILASFLGTPTVALKEDTTTDWSAGANTGIIKMAALGKGARVKPAITGGSGTGFQVALVPVDD